MTAPRSRFVVINGEIAAPERAVVSVYDRGFLYGDSVFEVLRTYQHKAFALAEHVTRLFESARRISMQMPISQQALMAEVHRSIEASDEPECLVRIHVT
jgi:branched-chain amino acid aminotransferase